MYRHGAQGVLDGASKALLENEFGTSKDDVCMTKILERGEYQTSSVRLPIVLRLFRRPWTNADIMFFFFFFLLQAHEQQSTRNAQKEPSTIMR